MGPLAAYSIKSAILLTVMFTAYMLTLSRMKNAPLRRAALIGIYIITLALPLKNFIAGTKASLPVEYTTPNMTAYVDEYSHLQIIFDIIAITIAGGITLMMVITIYNIISMCLLRLRSKTIYSNGYRPIAVKGKEFSPFCFCGRIFVPEKDSETIPQMILAHEYSHILHAHFIDLILGRAVLILQWWNPAAWLMARELQEVHEYQADNEVLKSGFNCKEYQYLLLEKTAGNFKVPLVSSGFMHCKLKKRLKMMNREDSSKRKGAVGLLIIPAAITAIFLLSTPAISSITRKVSYASIDYYFHNSSAEPQIMINGALTTFDYTYIDKHINPDAIERIAVWQNRLYPNGLIEINTKQGEQIFNFEEKPEQPKIEVIGYGIAKKETTKY